MLNLDGHKIWPHFNWDTVYELSALILDPARDSAMFPTLKLVPTPLCVVVTTDVVVGML